jgi:hypothetical protein
VPAFLRTNLAPSLLIRSGNRADDLVVGRDEPEDVSPSRTVQDHPIRYGLERGDTFVSKNEPAQCTAAVRQHGRRAT